MKPKKEKSEEQLLAEIKRLKKQRDAIDLRLEEARCALADRLALHGFRRRVPSRMRGVIKDGGKPAEVLAFLRQHGASTAKDVRLHCGITSTHAQTIFDKLIKTGRIRRLGWGTYAAAEEATDD